MRRGGVERHQIDGRDAVLQDSEHAGHREKVCISDESALLNGCRRPAHRVHAEGPARLVSPVRPEVTAEPAWGRHARERHDLHRGYGAGHPPPRPRSRRFHCRPTPIRRSTHSRPPLRAVRARSPGGRPASFGLLFVGRAFSSAVTLSTLEAPSRTQESRAHRVVPRLVLQNGDRATMRRASAPGVANQPAGFPWW